MKVGVIITVYNLELYVDKAIRSALNQSCRADKIVVIDDGSKDNSLSIISEFENSVIVLRNLENLGVLPSTIRCLRILEDMDIVLFLDGDDEWHPHKLDKVKRVFQTRPEIMMVTHNYEWIDRKGTRLKVQDQTHKNLARISNLAKGDSQKLDTLLKNSILGYKGVWLGSAFSIRLNLLALDEFERWSLSLEGHSLSHQDQPLAAFIIWKHPGGLISYIDEVLFFYRVFGENSSGSSSNLAMATMTLQRSRATILRTMRIVENIPNRTDELKRQRLKMCEIEYLMALYEGRPRLALQLFFKAWVGLWSAEHKKKELLRVVGVFVLGANRFLKMKSRYSYTK